MSASTRQKRAKALLDAFLGQTRGSPAWQRALRALTLFMLRGHAPKFFAQHQLGRVLDAAVKRLAVVPRGLPVELPAIDAMSRLDAAWVEAAVGKKPALPAAEEARAYVAAAKERDGLLWAWVMSELGDQLGLGCKLELASARPLKKADLDEEDLYWVTHQILLACRYFSKPVPPGAFAAEALELASALGPLEAVKDVDLLSEVTFCLQAIGGSVGKGVDMVEAFVGERGQVGKETGYSGAHAVAAALVALAGALDRGS